DRLRRLVAEADVAREPVLGLLTLGQLAADEGATERLLRGALRARPQEVALYQALGHLLAHQQRWAEAVECFTAARALRPDLGVALAGALVKAGRAGEGVALSGQLA